MDQPSTYLYHITFAIRLRSIRQEGLRLGTAHRSTFGGYGGNVKGRVFLTTAEGVSYWFGKVSDQVENHCPTASPPASSGVR